MLVTEDYYNAKYDFLPWHYSEVRPSSLSCLAMHNLKMRCAVTPHMTQKKVLSERLWTSTR